MYYALIFISLHSNNFFLMSTRFGACVSHSADSIVMETLLEKLNIAWLFLHKRIKNTCPGKVESYLLGKPTTLSSIGRLNEVMAIVNTLMESTSFAVGDGASPATVTLSGVAVIGFKITETRKLITVGMKGGDNIRKVTVR